MVTIENWDLQDVQYLGYLSDSRQYITGTNSQLLLYSDRVGHNRTNYKNITYIPPIYTSLR